MEQSSTWSGASAASSPPPSESARLPGLKGSQAEKQLTPREVQALQAIKRKVDQAKTIGWIIGGLGTAALLHRRKPRPSNFQIAGISFIGGLGGSFLTMPLGVMMSSSALKQVEDPQHLARVLQGAVEERRRGGQAAIGVAPPQGLGGERKWESAPQSEGVNRFGQRGAPTGISNANFPASSSGFGLDQDRPGQAGRSPNVGGVSINSGPGPYPSDSPADSDYEKASPSRWAQLRAERGVEPSKWEKIRQDNARKSLSQNRTSSVDPALDNGPRPGEFPTNEDQSSLQGRAWSLQQQQKTGPGSFAPRQGQREEWGEDEFLPDTGGDVRPQSQNPRSYGIHSVIEEKSKTSSKGLSGFEADSEAPFKVVKGSLLTALVGTLGGSAYGVAKGQTGAGTVLGMRTGINFFAFGFPFFALREYLINPCLSTFFADTYRPLPTTSDPNALSPLLRRIPNPHSRDVISSGLSGALVGGGIAAMGRGRGSIPSGVVMFGLSCAALQFTGNEARILRIKLLSQATQSAPSASPGKDLGATPPTESSSTSRGSTVDPMLTVATSDQSLTSTSTKMEVEPPTSRAEEKQEPSLYSRLKSLSPVQAVSDDQYEQKLLKRLKGVEDRLRDIESEVAQLERESQDLRS